MALIIRNVWLTIKNSLSCCYFWFVIFFAQSITFHHKICFLLQFVYFQYHTTFTFPTDISNDRFETHWIFRHPLFRRLCSWFSDIHGTCNFRAFSLSSSFSFRTMKFIVLNTFSRSYKFTNFMFLHTFYVHFGRLQFCLIPFSTIIPHTQSSMSF